MLNYSADSISDMSNTGSRQRADRKSLAGRELQNPDVISPREKEMAPALQW